MHYRNTFLIYVTVVTREGNEAEGEDCREAGAKGVSVMEGIVGMTLVEGGNKKRAQNSNLKKITEERLINNMWQ
jgi:hypothetical protein